MVGSKGTGRPTGTRHVRNLIVKPFVHFSTSFHLEPATQQPAAATNSDRTSSVPNTAQPMQHNYHRSPQTIMHNSCQRCFRVRRPSPATRPIRSNGSLNKQAWSSMSHSVVMFGHTWRILAVHFAAPRSNMMYFHVVWILRAEIFSFLVVQIWVQWTFARIKIVAMYGYVVWNCFCCMLLVVREARPIT